MRIIHYSDIESFFVDNLAFLEEEEAVNNLLIGIPKAIASASSAPANINLYSVKDDEDKTLFALVQTPPHNYLIYAKEGLPPSVFQQIIPKLKAENIQASGVIGPEDIALAFAKEWQAITGQTWKIGLLQLIYQLDELKTIHISEGKLRLAQESDMDTLIQWWMGFAREAMNDQDPIPNPKAIFQKIRKKDLYLWEDGELVTMTAVGRPTRNGITVNYVYTPAEFRGRGYASSCVYMVSKAMLEKYKFCDLFTDRTNATSNKIYKRMGYYPIKKFLEITFTSKHD